MKYKLTDETIVKDGVTLYRIQAIKSFSNVEAGDLGGFVEKENNLSQYGDAWVYHNGCVTGNGCVSGYGCVTDNGRVTDNGCVTDNGRVTDNGCVSGNGSVTGNGRVTDNGSVTGNGCVTGYGRVTGRAILAGDAWVSGSAVLEAKLSYTKGLFIGGDDTQKITNITDKTGSTYWESQYVLGDYEINPIEETEKEKKTVTLELSDEQLEKIKTILDN